MVSWVYFVWFLCSCCFLCESSFRAWRGTLLVNLSSQAYSNLLRAHMDGLKKKDKKSKSKKTKATQWATDSWTWPWVPDRACAVWGKGLVAAPLGSFTPRPPPNTVHPPSDSFDIMPLFAWSTLTPGCSVPSVKRNRTGAADEEGQVSTLQPRRPRSQPLGPRWLAALYLICPSIML